MKRLLACSALVLSFVAFSGNVFADVSTHSWDVNSDFAPLAQGEFFKSISVVSSGNDSEYAVVTGRHDDNCEGGSIRVTPYDTSNNLQYGQGFWISTTTSNQREGACYTHYTQHSLYAGTTYKLDRHNYDGVYITGAIFRIGGDDGGQDEPGKLYVSFEVGSPYFVGEIMRQAGFDFIPLQHTSSVKGSTPLIGGISKADIVFGAEPVMFETYYLGVYITDGHVLQGSITFPGFGAHPVYVFAGMSDDAENCTWSGEGFKIDYDISGGDAWCRMKSPNRISTDQ